MVQQLLPDFIKLILQLLLLGVVGGAVSWYYSKIQKRRELRSSLLKDFAGLHGRFLSLRFRFNSFHIDGAAARPKSNHPLTDEEIRKASWTHFEEACSLLGEFYGIMPVIQSQFRALSGDIETIHSIYQQWRRQIRAGSPILQDRQGHSSNQYKQLRSTYHDAVQCMRHQI